MEPRNPERAARQAAAMREALARFDAEDAERAQRQRSSAAKPAAPSVPAGWYPHPSMADTQRYWDGAHWTEHIAPMATPAVRVTDAGSTAKLETWGWLGAFFFPIVGIVIGIMLLSRPGKNNGGWILGISAGWIVLLWTLISLSQPTYY